MRVHMKTEYTSQKQHVWCHRRALTYAQMSVSLGPAQWVKYSTLATIPADFSTTIATKTYICYTGAVLMLKLEKKWAEGGERGGREKGKASDSWKPSRPHSGLSCQKLGGCQAVCRVEYQLQLLRFNKTTVPLKAQVQPSGHKFVTS